jgi:hypothetical protein
MDEVFDISGCEAAMAVEVENDERRETRPKRR